METQGFAAAALVKGAVIVDNARYPDLEIGYAMPDAQTQENEHLAELIHRGAQGDERALEVLYGLYKRPLFSLACRYAGNVSAAEDILQEVFLRAFTRLGDVDNVATFSAWLYRITVNASLSYLRTHKKERKATVPLSEVEAVAAAPANGSDSAPASLRRPLENAIQALSPRLKSVFLLHDVQGFKHEEIASMLGCSEGTSKSNLFKARLKLRGHLIRSRTVKE